MCLHCPPPPPLTPTDSTPPTPCVFSDSSVVRRLPRFFAATTILCFLACFCWLVECISLVRDSTEGLCSCNLVTCTLNPSRVGFPPSYQWHPARAACSCYAEKTQSTPCVTGFRWDVSCIVPPPPPPPPWLPEPASVQQVFKHPQGAVKLRLQSACGLYVKGREFIRHRPHPPLPRRALPLDVWQSASLCPVIFCVCCSLDFVSLCQVWFVHSTSPCPVWPPGSWRRSFRCGPLLFCVWLPLPRLWASAVWPCASPDSYVRPATAGTFGPRRCLSGAL